MLFVCVQLFTTSVFLNTIVLLLVFTKSNATKTKTKNTNFTTSSNAPKKKNYFIFDFIQKNKAFVHEQFI